MKWKAIIEALLYIIERLIVIWERQRRREEHERRQENRDQAAVDPAGAFADHFSGVSASKAVPNDASETDKTDTGSD